MPFPELRVFICCAERPEPGKRFRTSVEASQNQRVFNAPGGVIAEAITPLSLQMNTLSSGDGSKKEAEMN